MTEFGREAPCGADLLAIARETLLTDIVPKLEGDARFKALMIANAMAIAARETQAAVEAIIGATPAGLAKLCRDIRLGRCDPHAPHYAAIQVALLRFAEARCAVSAPKAIASQE